MSRQAPDAAGDGEFEAFFVSHRTLYWRIALTIVGSPAVADDVTQDTFSAIYARWDRLQATKVEAYCRTMLVNAALGAVRKRKRERLTDAPDLLALSAADATDPTRGHELRLDLVAALRDLKPGYRAVLALRYLEDLSVAEVAAVLGISEGTVKSQTARALALLRRRYDAADAADDVGDTVDTVDIVGNR